MAIFGSKVSDGGRDEFDESLEDERDESTPQQVTSEAPAQQEPPKITEQKLGDDEIGKAAGQQVSDRDTSAPNSIIYTGIASRRAVTREEFLQAGVTDQEGLVWDRANRFSVSLDQVSDSALRVLRQESSFKINN